MLKGELETKTMKELRKLAIKAGITGSAMLKIRKPQMVDYLAEDVDKAFNGQTSIPVTEAQVPETIPETVPEKPLFAKPEQPKSTNNGNGKGDQLATVIAQAIQDKINVKGSVDETKVTEIANRVFSKKLDILYDEIKQEVSANMKPTEIIVADLPKVNVGRQHELFEKIVTLTQLRENIMLVGPAGSGKTTVAKNAAKACGLRAEAMSVGIQTTKTDLLGYMDANGRYVPSILRRLYEHGGLFVLDEVDGGNANVLTILNSLLDNGEGSFPDQVIKRHEDFVCIATANTYGRGADRMYVGRNQLDAATLDRFIVLNFEYDYEFENAISPNKQWTKKVQKLRNAIFDLQERILCTPRVSIKGAKMLANGFTEDECLDALVFKGVHSDTRSKVMARGWV